MTVTALNAILREFVPWCNAETRDGMRFYDGNYIASERESSVRVVAQICMHSERCEDNLGVLEFINVVVTHWVLEWLALVLGNS